MSFAPVACTDSESWWRAHLERQPRSGLTVREYCEREGFSQASFYNWRKRLRSSPVEPSPFLELTPLLSSAPSSGSEQWEMEIALPGGVCLRLARGCDPESLRRVLEVLPRC